MSNNKSIQRYGTIPACTKIDCSIDREICLKKGCGPCSKRHGSNQSKCTKKRIVMDNLSNRYNNSHKETETFKNFKMGDLFWEVYKNENPELYEDKKNLTLEQVKKELIIEFNNNKRNPEIKKRFKRQNNKSATEYAEYCIKINGLKNTRDRIKKYYDSQRLFKSYVKKEKAGRQFRYYTLTPISTLSRTDDKKKALNLVKTCGNYDPHMTVEYSRNPKGELEIVDAHFTCGTAERDLNGDVLSAQSWQIDENELKSFSRSQNEYSQTQQYTLDEKNIEARRLLTEIQANHYVTELHQYFHDKIHGLSTVPDLNILIELMEKCLLIEEENIFTEVSGLIGDEQTNLDQKLQEIGNILEKQGVLLYILNKHELNKESLLERINDYLRDAGDQQNVFLHVQKTILDEIDEYLKENESLNDFFDVDDWEALGRRKSLKKRKISKNKISKNKRSKKRKRTNKKKNK